VTTIYLQLETPFSEDVIGEQLKGVDDPAKIPGGAEKLRVLRKLSSYFSGPPVKHASFGCASSPSR